MPRARRAARRCRALPLSNVRVLVHPGPYVEALNAGLEAATGAFVVIHGADDRSHPQRLARQVAYLKAHPEIGVLASATGTLDAKLAVAPRGRPRRRRAVLDARGHRGAAAQRPVLRSWIGDRAPRRRPPGGRLSAPRRLTARSRSLAAPDAPGAFREAADAPLPAPAARLAGPRAVSARGANQLSAASRRARRASASRCRRRAR